MSKLNIILLFILAGLLIFAQADSAMEEKWIFTIPTPTPTFAPTPTPTPTISVPKAFYIPKINVSAPIVPVGTDENGKMLLPENVAEVGWYSLGVKPGEIGNAVISGHLDSTTGEGAIFYHLNELELGDNYYVTDEYGKSYTFAVTDKVIYEYDKVPIDEVFGETDKKRLNLITCTGSWNPSLRNYSHRMIIYSELQSVSVFIPSPTTRIHKSAFSSGSFSG